MTTYPSAGSRHRPAWPSVRWLAGAGLLLATTACAGSSGDEATSTTSTTSRTEAGHVTPVSAAFDVGSHVIAYRCTGTRAPTVLLEAPFLTDSTIWAPIERALQRRDFAGTVCVYDRAGLGHSPAIGSHTINDSVTDLAALMTRIAPHPPRIMVGYSYGGLVIRLLAARHPNLVDGMVLAEATPTGFHAEAIPLVAPEDRNAFVAADNSEDVPGLMDAARVVARESTPRSLHVPLTVIIARRGIEYVDKDRPNVAAQINAIYKRTQAATAELSDRSTTIEAPNSAHVELLEADTGIVVDAILGAVADAR
jgi:pimeloyl-ACP methyl ester carboxylesterase